MGLRCIAQKGQKTQYDRHAQTVKFEPGDWVLVYMLAARSSRAFKLARPYRSRPYCVITSTDSNVEVHPVDQLNAKSICVALDHEGICPNEIPDVFCPRKTCPTVKNTGTAEDMVPQTELTDRPQPRNSCGMGMS